jgi:hypothetical protein
MKPLLIFFEIGFTVLIIGIEFLLGWEILILCGRFGYVEMKVFNDKNYSFMHAIYLCTTLPAFYGCPYNVRESWFNNEFVYTI